jgi:hypothetical protein
MEIFGPYAIFARANLERTLGGLRYSKQQLPSLHC